MLRHSDSFDDRPITAIGGRYESHVYNVSADSGIYTGRTGNGLGLSTGILDVFDHITWQAETTLQTIYAGVAHENAYPRGALISIRYNGIPQIYAQLNADRTISVIRYDGGANTVLSTSGQAVPASSSTGFFYVEFMGKIDTSNGNYELRIDGTRWLSGSGLNTSSTGDSLANQVRVINNSAVADGSVTIIDDFYIADEDDAGGDANITGFAGPVKIAYQPINGAGASSEWTPLSGSNYQNVDETTGEDGDTSFVATLTEGAVDLYAVQSFEVVNATVKAVAVHSWLKKMDGLSRPVTPMTYVSGAEYAGDEAETAASYERVFQAFEKNPATGAVWTRAQVAAAQFGMALAS